MCKFSSKYLQDFSYEGWFKNCFHVKYYFHTQDAKKDESVRKSYKYLAALHEVRNRACLDFLHIILPVVVVRE